MIRGLTAANDIATAQRALREAAYANGVLLERTVGFPGGSNRVEIAWHPGIGVWVHIDTREEATRRDGHPTHYWNPIGLADASPENANLSVAVEVNPPIEGATARIAGLFGREDDGTIALLHRGKIGGGRAGVGQELFWQMFQGQRAFAGVAGELVDCAIVTRLGSASVITDLHRFAADVARMKATVRRR
ncbi:MAG: hypothetical protein R3C39_10330 [Dehalococcoidia bacterium]